MRKQRTTATIITADYGAYALALHDSLMKFDEEINMAIFISSGKLDEAIQKEFDKRKNIKLYFGKDIMEFPLAKNVYEKYYEASHDSYRWSMKPVFMNFLLHKDFKEVIYLDSDIFFFNDYTFLWKELDGCNILLSPHWRSSDPVADLPNFKLNFLDGIYNGGFIGASRGGIAALDYWAKLCLYNCEVNRNEGFYVDQRYLDLLPTRFEGVENITHKGCNVANWNQLDCKRTKKESGEVVINNVFPIIFIHFTNSFLRGILLQNDKLLLPFLEQYRDNLLRYSDIDIIEKFHKKGRFKQSRIEKPELKTRMSFKKGIFKKLKSFFTK